MTQLASSRTFRKGGKDYRRWTKEQKCRIVEESFLPGASVSVVARRHDVNANQVFAWRQKYRRGELGSEGGAPAGFIPVALLEQGGTAAAVPLVRPLPSTAPATRAISGVPQGSALAQRKQRTDILQLELTNGVKLKLNANINTAALRQVLYILREVV